MSVFENCSFESVEPELLLSSAFTLTAVAFKIVSVILWAFVFI